MPQELTSQLQAKVSAFIAAAKDMTGNGVTRSILKDVTGELEKLAVSKELFPRSEFPPPDGPTNILYQIACDPDGQYALYVSSANKGKKTPPHNHATWAVIVGIEGDERHRAAQQDPCLGASAAPREAIGGMPWPIPLRSPSAARTIGTCTCVTVPCWKGCFRLPRTNSRGRS